jgi:hypothetical protein
VRTLSASTRQRALSSLSDANNDHTILPLYDDVMTDSLYNSRGDTSPSAVLVAADVGLSSYVVYHCSHVHLTTVTPLRPLQIRDREKSHWTPRHSSFTRHPPGPFCLRWIFTDIQRLRVGNRPQISSNSSVSSIKVGLSRHLNHHHSIVSSPITP